MLSVVTAVPEKADVPVYFSILIVDDDKSYINGGNFATVGQFSNLNNSFYPSQRLDEGVANVASVRYSSSFSFQIPISAINMCPHL